MRVVQPRHHTPRSDLPTRGRQVAQIAAAKGRPFMRWQQDAADVALEYDPETGLYRYSTVVVTVQRQAGKTTWIGSIADHRCMRRPGARAWITMQSGKMANTWMRNEHQPSLRAFGNPKSASSPYRLSKRAEETGVIWPAVNSRFIAFPPKADALHSQQGDLIIVSEAWALDPVTGAAVRQAYRPTMATRAGSQVVIESTKGDDSSVWFQGFLDLGEASLLDPNSSVAIIDYGIPDDADAEDLDVIAEYHPAYCPHPENVRRVTPTNSACCVCGGTITMHSLRVARDEFDADPELGGAAGWARAYGNRATLTKETVFSDQVWTNTARARPAEVPDRAGIAVDATPTGDRVAIVTGWRDEEDHAYGDVVYADAPTRELPQILVDLSRKRRAPLTVCRDSVGTLELMDAVLLARPKQDIRFLSTAEYSSACVTAKRGILGNTFHHFNDTALDDAAKIVVQGKYADGGIRWLRANATGSIAEFVAFTVSVKAFDMLPRRSRSESLVTSG